MPDLTSDGSCRNAWSIRPQSGMVTTVSPVHSKDVSLPQYGDEENGFSVESGLGKVLVRAWGFWSAQLALRFAPAVSAVLGGSPKGAALVLDVAQLRPLREEGQDAFGALLSHALAQGAAEVVIRSPSALTKLQMTRLAKQVGSSGQIKVE